MTDLTTPRHLHGCQACTYLGQQGDSDLYVHAPHHPTVIARFSSDGPGYTSGLEASYGQNMALTEARRRAEAWGLLQPNLRYALVYTAPAATGPLRAELEACLNASPMAKALQALQKSAGIDQLVAVLKASVNARTTEFADIPVDTVVDWEVEHARHANEWLQRLGLPYAQQELLQCAFIELLNSYG